MQRGFDVPDSGIALVGHRHSPRALGAGAGPVLARPRLACVTDAPIDAARTGVVVGGAHRQLDGDATIGHRRVRECALDKTAFARPLALVDYDAGFL